MKIFSEAETRNRSAALDLLRIFACLWVCVFHWQGNSGEKIVHIKYPFGSLHWPVVPGFLSIGYMGVDIFFILSGCVIANTALNRDPAKFLAARFWRLFPSIFIVSLLTMGIRLLGKNQTFGQQKYNFGHGLLNATALPLFASISGGQHSFWIPDTWTLPVEFLFYFVMAAIIIIFGRLNLSRLTTYTIFSTLLLFFLRENLVKSFTIYFLFGILFYCINSWSSLIKLSPVLIIASYLLYAQVFDRIYFAFANGGHSRISAQIFSLIFVFTIGNILLLKDAIVIKSPQREKAVRLLALMTFPFYLLHASFGLQLVNLLYQHSIGFKFSCLVTFGVLIFLSWICVRFFEPAFRAKGRSLVAKVFLQLI
jgi:peptidoglycan/LPS O-acetylase OafA/YrhL